MRENTQAFRHCPASGQYGDCFRTAVSCLLELPRDAVPHVFHDGVTGEEADRRMDKWLSTLGLVQITIPFDGKLSLDDLLRSVGKFSARPEYLLTGTSKNGVGHVVVCCGRHIAWDPSIDGSGIVGPASDGYWWVTAIAVTRPTKKITWPSMAVTP